MVAKKSNLALVAMAWAANPTHAYNNGVAATPPMGWVRLPRLIP